MGKTIATCPRKVDLLEPRISYSRRSVLDLEVLGDQEQSHYLQSLRRVSIENSIKAWVGIFYSSAYCRTHTFLCTEPTSTVSAPFMLPDCIAHIQ